jgi:hypothetical protein
VLPEMLLFTVCIHASQCCATQQVALQLQRTLYSKRFHSVNCMSEQITSLEKGRHPGAVQKQRHACLDARACTRAHVTHAFRRAVCTFIDLHPLVIISSSLMRVELCLVGPPGEACEGNACVVCKERTNCIWP